VGKYVMGRRRYSWEKRPRGRKRSSASDGGIGGLLMLVLLSWLFAKPIFYVLMALIGFILVCLAVMGLCRAVEWLAKLACRLPQD
jgi:hypothetical protein